MFKIFSEIIKKPDFMFFFIINILFFYLIGSIPIGLLIGKIFKKKDLSLLGSKNIGSSNATRILGFKYGLLIFFLDFFKGIISIWLGSVFIEKYLEIQNISPTKLRIEELRIYFGLSVILGHIFPLFHKFKGGKAVATSVAIISFINPFVGIIGILSFFVFLRLFGYASLASLISILIVNFLLLICFYFNFLNYFFIQIEEIICIFILSIIIFIKHSENIKKLLEGTENKFIFDSVKNNKK
jgi:glycerol-3-phosphate acyltransferase PlsY